MYNFDNVAAYLKWLNDLKDEQQPNGTLPGSCPLPAGDIIGGTARRGTARTC